MIKKVDQGEFDTNVGECNFDVKVEQWNFEMKVVECDFDIKVNFSHKSSSV